MRALPSALAAAWAAAGWAQAPALSAESAIAVDARSGRVLFERSAEASRAPASTTKIATALVVLERCRLDEPVTVSREASKQPGSSFHLREGEQISVRDALYATMLRSANDAAYALAEHAAGSVEQFTIWMNELAKEAGCTSTTFVNPHGLPDPRHRTTAHDLARIARKAMRDPEFAAIVATQKHLVPRGSVSTDTLLVNRNQWIFEDPTALGIKTGTTLEAGRCFVGSAERPGGKVLTVLLRSKDWLADQRALTAWLYEEFSEREVAAPGREAGRVQVERGERPTVAVSVARPVVTMERDGAPAPRIVGAPTVRAPVQSGERIGAATLVLEDGTEFPVELVAAESVDLPWYDRVWPAAAAATALGGAWFTFARRRGR